jgi:hypothetical protein
MRFKEGLVRARGQIAFILALAVSTAIIVRLEYLSTEQYIEKRITDGVVARNTSDPVVQALADSALRRARAAAAAAPLSSEDRAALATALASSRLVGAASDEDALVEAKVLFGELERGDTALGDAARSVLAAAFPELAAHAGLTAAGAAEGR